VQNNDHPAQQGQERFVSRNHADHFDSEKIIFKDHARLPVLPGSTVTVVSENRVREVTCGTWAASQANFLLAF